MPKIKSNKKGKTYDEGIYVANVDNSVTILALMAPWCGHCQALKPTWNKLMDEFNNKDSPKNAMIAALEEGQYEGKKGCGGVRGYPTIRLVKNGKFQKDYQGSRDEAALKHFIETELGLKAKWKGGRKRRRTRRRKSRRKRRKSRKRKRRRTRKRRRRR
tara:strand:+ start:124 stop:600 length:477 start_codon:yes stop_codon:yes gene_type:complete